MTSQNQDKPGQDKPGQQSQNPSQKPGQPGQQQNPNR